MGSAARRGMATVIFKQLLKSPPPAMNERTFLGPFERVPVIGRGVNLAHAFLRPLAGVMWGVESRDSSITQLNKPPPLETDAVYLGERAEGASLAVVARNPRSARRISDQGRWRNGFSGFEPGRIRAPGGGCGARDG